MGHHSSRTRINARARGGGIWPLFTLSHGQLLKSGLGPLARYCTHQTISGRPEQEYLHLTQDLNGMRRDHYWVTVRQTYVFTFAGSRENLPDVAKSRDATMDNKEFSSLIKQNSFLF